ncbi:DUF192 domain-containing protein [Arenibacterium sp. CAU 1754]
MRFWLALGLGVFWAAQVQAQCALDSVQLRGDWGQVRFSVEIADDVEERSRGLMFRRDMPRNAGMLFVYDAPQRANFWMKNTLIPLDMVFVDRSGVVTRVHHDAVPGDLTTIEGGQNVYAVLEINAGLARSYGIGVGSQLRHPVFSGGPAIWPC